MGIKRYFNAPCECTDSPLGALHLWIGMENGERVGKCDICGKINLKALPQRTMNVKKQGWPYYNASVGVTFESESHEQKYTKEHNLTKRE